MALRDCTTLTEIIVTGRSNDFNMNEYCKKINIAGSILTVSGNIIDRYFNFIEKNKILVNLDSYYDEVKYNIKRLSYILYGTEELYYILLKLNNISSEIEFNKPKAYIVAPDILIEILNKIYKANYDTLEKNKREY